MSIFTEQMIFTNNWFDRNINISMKLLENLLPIQNPISILEIGSHEGKSTVYMLKKFCINPQSTFLSIDPYLTEDTTSPVDEKTLKNFLHNIKVSGQSHQLTQYIELSNKILPKLNDKYDLIYIDGSHLYDDVLFDIEHSVRLCKKGGYILMDDVGYDSTSGVYKALKTFYDKNPNILTIVLSEYQVLLCKN